ncbi:hypothetical protein KAR91_33205 [Candidatus Pacearchaeota archaeon]|nr:hypothetical protein [Candidatus Pacearchaeota archaeon]
MKKVLIIIVIFFLTSCSAKESNDDRTISPVGPDIIIRPTSEIITLNYEVELLTYTQTDSAVKMRLLIENSGDTDLKSLSIVFKGDTCHFTSDSSWKEVVMKTEDNINLDTGETYRSVNYDEKFWYYFTHNNCNKWIGSHYVTYFVYDSSFSILATDTIYYDEKY